MNDDLRGLVQKWRDRAIAVGWLTHGGLARQECADELEAEASSLRGLLAGLREAITDWGDNMRSETMGDLLAHVDRIEQSLSVAQGQGWEAVPEHVRKLIGQIDCYRLRMSYNESYFGEPAGLLKGVFAELGHAANPIYPSGKTALYPGLPAAPAQPDGVSE